MKHLLYFIAFLSLTFPLRAQQGFVHQPSAPDRYVWPNDPAVLDKLEQWQDLKFGVLIHYGLYSIPGIVESWSICSEDVDWINRPHKEMPYEDYKKWYWGLSKDFKPTAFDPAKWAELMEDAGMKYAILTTKHHDGFCLFDSQFTDFTAPANGQPDVVRGFTDAFRDKGMMVGTYFSKPDWHSPYFWNPQFATPRRGVNYSRERHPDWWQKYCQFTRDQLGEITTNYSPDILWLDGGWVAGEEIGLDDVLVAARKHNPGMIAVDRSIGGRNENYQTPERGIPATIMDHPWESCIPLSDDWGWVPNPNWKSADKVIALLAETVAKGGSLALGVGPTADGDIQPEVTERLAQIGKWLKANGAAIYGTRPLSPDRRTGGNTQSLWFTQAKDGNTVYGIYAPEAGKGEKTLIFSGVTPKGDIALLEGGKLEYKVKDGKTTVTLPKNLKAPFAFQFIPSVPAASPLSAQDKIAQLCCLLGWEMYDGTEPSEKFKETLKEAPIGGLWATLRADPWTKKTLDNGLNPMSAPEATANLQKYYQDQLTSTTGQTTSLMLAEECPHGHMAIGATVFPTGLSQASTFNPALIRQMGDAIAREALAQGATVGYGPVLDIARDPRWSRMEETFGEDVELVSQMGVAYIKGMQEAGLPATMKHFAAYGIPMGGHNGGDAEVGEWRLRTEYLEPARRAVQDGKVASVMTSYNSIDGVPSTANRWLLTDVLRDEWGFDGMVVSDLIAINGIAGSGYAKDYVEAAAMALNAGVDMDLGGGVYGGYLEDALDKGLVTEQAINQAFNRVQAIKTKCHQPQQTDFELLKAKSSQIARQVATEGTVLLKNDGILPLDKRRIKKIAVLGPNADAIYNQLGDYTAPQPRQAVVTPLDGIKAAVGKDTEIAYKKVCGIRQTVTGDSLRNALRQPLQDADVAIVVVGGSSGRDFKTEYIDTGAAKASGELADMECGEGMDRSTLDLLGSQDELIQAVADSGIPMVVVYIEGRPLDMNTSNEVANAMLTQWYPGAQGGAALADILFGDANPSGKLPVSIPRHVGQIPVHYSQPHRADYVDGSSQPLFPFGFGKSYTTYEYGQPKVVGDSVFVTVSNTGTVDGLETVQLYRLQGNSIHLKDFKKVAIPAGASVAVAFASIPGQLFVGASSNELAEVEGTYENSTVQVRDGQFISDGKPYRFVGANAWYLPLLAAQELKEAKANGTKTLPPGSRLMAELDTLQALGIDNLRILVGSEGATSHQCQISPNLQTAPGEYDQDLLDGLDLLIAEMERRGMKGVFYLTNSWEWSGGYNTYLDWAGGGKPVLPTIDGYQEYLDHATKFFENDKARELFAKHVKAIVPRYVGSPAVMSWQIANEPRAFSKRNKPQFEEWILQTANLIKSLDPLHMVSVGSEGYNGCEVDLDLWTRIHESPDIDYATIHIWPTNWGWAQRDNLVRDLPQACTLTDEYITDHCRAIAHTGKPIVIEEFGFPRDGMAFSRESSTNGRNAYYRHLMDRFINNPQISGVNFWGWGGLAIPRHESWQKGDPFTCDPAHEQQGLYSVFASDQPTILLIQDAIQELKNRE